MEHQLEERDRLLLEKRRAELDRRLQRVRSGREARRQAGAHDALPSVPALFRHKDVLVTGGSGFLGRVLVEKLLRSCPDVGTVFLLLRPRKGLAPAERIRSVVDVPLFDQVRREQPDALAKLVAVAGDCAELGLGLGAEDRALLQERVSIVFHGAASVRFDDPVRKAVLLNTRGCRELVELCGGMKRLEALVHISTAYTNTNQRPIEERLYPTHIDWRQAIQYATDPSIAGSLDHLGQKFLGFQPNTYTFSKALAEQVMGEAASRLPVVIVRPAIVVGAILEPLPGWLDNINSPAALWMAAAKGVIRATPFMEANPDYVPVDLVAKVTILAAWAKATKQDLGTVVTSGKESAVSVVNMSLKDVHQCPVRIQKALFQLRGKTEVPFTSAVRYPYFVSLPFRWQYQLYVFFYHVLFGLAVDLLLKLSNRKPKLMRAYRNLEVAHTALSYFILGTFEFKTDRLWRLQSLLHPDDEAAFDYDIQRYDPTEYSVHQLKGIMEYALKEKFDREKGSRHNQRLLWLEIVFYAFLVATLVYFVRPFSYLW